MDQNGSLLLEIETTKPNKRSNKYYLFIKKTLPFLVPVSLLSFLLTYASCFSSIFPYNFHFSTLFFPFFSHALERKYMFLICNGILAFLAKTLSLNSSSPPPITDLIHDESMISSTELVKPTSQTPVMEKSLPNFEESVAPEEKEKEEEHYGEVYISRSYEEDKLLQEEAKASEGRKEGQFQSESPLIIESEGEQDDYEMEESASLLGASAAEQGNEINLNTEELNQKFEEFIRKMKEEIRIEAQQQLVVA